MKLILDRMDLRPEHGDESCSKIKIYHFKTEVQEAVAVIGRATFREYDGSSYQAVFVPALPPHLNSPDIIEIAGKLVAVPSCRLYGDKSIIANVQIIDGREVVYSQQIQVRDGEITVDDLIFKRQGRQMSREEFSQFLNENFTAVFDHIRHLLTSAEAAIFQEGSNDL